MRHFLSLFLLLIPITTHAQADYVLETTKSRRVEAVLSFKAEHPNLQARQWYLFVPKLPELPGQTKVRTQASAASTEISDLSPLKRPLLAVQVPAETPKLRTSVSVQVTYEATLHERKLRPRKPDEKAPQVPKLSDEERKLFLAAHGDIDHQAKAVQQWIKDNNLKRQPAESDVDFGRRVFLKIRSAFGYDYRHAMDRRASQVCRAGKADCGGLCILFVAVLRANDIPARVLYGRWAQSAKPGEKINGIEYHQSHVLAEFYADGVGWVPVDPASAILYDDSQDGLEYFGQNLGAFFAFHIDPNVLFDTTRFGRHETHALQSPNYFVAGQGLLRPGIVTHDWQVKK